MFASILDHAKALKQKVGCRVLTTHAKKETKAYNWYLKIGFMYSHEEKRIEKILTNKKLESVPMFYDINRIIK